MSALPFWNVFSLQRKLAFLLFYVDTHILIVSLWLARKDSLPVDVSLRCEPHQSVVSYCKKRYPHCSVLVGIRNRFETDLHFNLHLRKFACFAIKPKSININLTITESLSLKTSTNSFIFVQFISIALVLFRNFHFYFIQNLP